MLRGAASKLGLHLAKGSEPVSAGHSHAAHIQAEAVKLEKECELLGWDKITTVCIPGLTTAQE